MTLLSELPSESPAPCDPQKTFTDYGVDADIAQALAAAGITHPFPIQAMTLPLALAGNDIIGQAKTGTGKTLGFGIPLLQRIPAGSPPTPRQPRALVVVPTRELAIQVAEDLTRAASRRGSVVLAAYGGRAIDPQVQALAAGVHLVVGTPGRLIDLTRQRALDLSQVTALVLDEADQMLDMGFLEDMEQIISMTNPVRQTMLFSATLPGPIVALGRRYLSKPTQIRAADPTDDRATVEGVTQHILRVHNLDKNEVLARILQARGRGLTIVFTATKRAAKNVTDEMNDRGFCVGAVHGDLDQASRERALRAFRTGKVDVLVATDVAARGLDVDDVTHVVNYSCPKDPQIYLHRIGRTARAGAEGTAVTFVDWDAMHLWAAINNEHVLQIPDPLETYSTSPHLYELLQIDPSVTGRLPRSERTRAGLDAEQLEDIGATGVRVARERQGREGGARAGSGSRADSRGRTQESEAKRGEPSSSRRRRSRGGQPPAEGESGQAGNRHTRARRRTRAGQSFAVGNSTSADHEQAGNSGGEKPSRSRSRRRTRRGQASTSAAAE